MADLEEKKVVLTNTEVTKLKNELEDLRLNKRKEISAKIKEAREQGDLSENAEYDAAKEEQGHIEGRIKEIEETLKHAEIVDEREFDYSKINIGCITKVYDKEFDEEIEIAIVGGTETNSLENKISTDSPVGKALIGHGVGDEVEVETPNGIVSFKVLEVRKNENY